MAFTYSARDKFGSYQLNLESRIITSSVSGIIGLTLSKRFNREFCKLVDTLSGQRFAYFGDFIDCEGYTRDAANTLLSPREYGRDAGCVVDAFRIQSHLLIDQIDKLRMACGAKRPTSECIFDSVEECISFLKSNLELIDKHFEPIQETR